MSNEVTTRQQPAHTFADLERMAAAVAKSGLFAIKSPEAALTLMLIANEEGTGVAAACRDFNIIEGKPALKAEAMLSRFQKAGGQVEWHELTAEKADATFTPPVGTALRMDWTIEQARTAGLVKNNRDGGPGVWMKYPRAMLRNRLVSEGIRSVYPGSLSGAYTPEELTDEPTERDITPPRDAAEPLRKKDEPIDAEVVDKVTGEIHTGQAPPAQEPDAVMPEGEYHDHLSAIEAASTLADLKAAHARAYTVASKYRDKHALLQFEVHKNSRKYSLTKDGGK